MKAAFTRALNKSSALTPYSTVQAPKRKATSTDYSDAGYDEGEEEDGTSDADDDITADAMIKVCESRPMLVTCKL